MEDVDEESDEVLYNIDVRLSKVFGESLYLFDYPTKSINTIEKNDEEAKCLSAKFKPNQQKIELEMGINIHSSCYDSSRGEQIAFNVDGHTDASHALFQSPYMDKYVVVGSKIPSSSKNYGLGLWKNGEFTLMPFRSILELSPDFVHVDKQDSQAKKAQNLEEEDEEEEAVAVTVRFEGANADKVKENQKKSFHFHQQKSASEPWIELSYHPLGSKRSMIESQKMSISRYSGITNSFISPEEYLKRLIPTYLRQSENDTVTEEVENINEKPLSEQIKYLLKNAHIMTFSTLVKKLETIADEVSIERVLHQMAVLVRGCWAVKSEILYPEDFISPYTGLSSKTLVNARDYILWLFTKSPFITRKEVLSVIDVPNEDFLSMITPLAIKANRRWEFSSSDDQEFVESHPDVFERQNMKWDLRYKKLVKDLNIGMLETESFSSSSSKVPFNVTPRPRQKRHSRSSQSEGDESGTDSTYATKEYYRTTKRACMAKKNLNLSPSKQGNKAKPCHFATLDVSPTFLEVSPPAEVLTDLKEYVADVMRTQYCMPLTEIKTLVSQSHLSSLATYSEFDKILEEALVGCEAQKLRNKWPQNTNPETLYAFTKFGNKLDRYRNALLDLFTTTARARMNLFVKKVEDDLREIVSESDCRMLFEEYCVYKSGFYYLKGTIVPDS